MSEWRPNVFYFWPDQTNRERRTEENIRQCPTPVVFHPLEALKALSYRIGLTEYELKDGLCERKNDGRQVFSVFIVDKLTL